MSRSNAKPPRGPRRARLRALAKLNLELRVIASRPDGFHELRTIFQTISLADTIDLAFTPARTTSIELEDSLQIPDNLAARAARAILEESGAAGRVEIRLAKRIPMGAGLGGGSSDAAAILLALPVLAGIAIPIPRLCELAQKLGSDVPFFLLGGRAVGIGRGTELFPLPGTARRPGLLVASGLHVSTSEAYRLLDAGLTTESQQNKIFSFQSRAWDGVSESVPVNDFETVVFKRHRHLALLKERLERAGAAPALMTGSGSAVFGLFQDRRQVARAVRFLGDEKTIRFSPVSRSAYRSLWWRALTPHLDSKTWPPQSRYAR